MKNLPLMKAARGLFVSLMAFLGSVAALSAWENPLEPADTSSPRATLRSFLDATEDAYRRGAESDQRGSQIALERALRTLDLSQLPPRFAKDRGVEAALMLREVLDRIDEPAIEEIPSDEGLARWRIPQTEISIIRNDSGSRTGEFLFSPETVARASEFYSRVEHLPYEDGTAEGIYEAYLMTPGPGIDLAWGSRVPAWMKTIVAEQAVWQWLASVVVLTAALVFTVVAILGGTRFDRGRAASHEDQRKASGRHLGLMVALLASIIVTFSAEFVLDEQINLTGAVLQTVVLVLRAAGFAMLAWLAVLVIMQAASMYVSMRGFESGAATGRLIMLAAAGLAIAAVVAIFVYAGQALGLPAYSIVTGLGVGGIAIGFGAQTLVRDIISGIFFVVDDAFRPGEYIDTGAGKGFVENISVRSIRLRHHTGPLQTIPFGEIKRVNNFSRDWVVMKLNFRLRFGTDTERVRKLIKTLGQDLLKDPELGGKFIEPLKSQGVYEIDDFGIVMRVKFMTRPGEQFTLRRIIYVKIQELFRAEGIEFAGREVRVQGDLDPAHSDKTVRFLGQAADLGADQDQPASSRHRR